MDRRIDDRATEEIAQARRDLRALDAALAVFALGPRGGPPAASRDLARRVAVVGEELAHLAERLRALPAEDRVLDHTACRRVERPGPQH